MSDNPNPSQDKAASGQGSKPEPRKYANKYDSVDALETGYNNATREYGTLSAKLRELEAENHAMRVMADRKDAATAADSRAEKLNQLKEAGIDPDVLREVVTDIGANAAEQVADRRLKPAENAAIAFNAVAPEYQADASKLLSSDPTLNERYKRFVSSDPEMAGAMLQQEVQLRQLATANKPAEAQGDDNRAGRLRRVADAGVMPGSGGSPGGGDDDDNPDNERRLKMLEDQHARGVRITKKFASDFLAGTVDIWEDLHKPPRRI